jgi:hypothetical protein
MLSAAARPQDDVNRAGTCTCTCTCRPKHGSPLPGTRLRGMESHASM